MRVALCLLLAVVAWGVTINFPSGVTISNYNTLVSNVAYTVNMTFGSAIVVPANTIVTMQFSQHFIIDASTVGACKYLIGGTSYTTITCTTDYNANNGVYEINFLGIYPSTVSNQASLNLLFNVLNPMLVGTEHINIYLISGSTTLAGGLISLDYTASALTGCSYASSTDYTAVPSTFTFSFQPSVRVVSGSNFVATLPPWIADFSTNSASPEYGSAEFPCTPVSNCDSVPSCQNSISQSTASVFSDQFTVTGLIGTDRVLSSPIVFNGSGIYNPWSLAPFGPITFELQIFDTYKGLYVTSQICNNVYQSVTKMSTLASTFNISTNLNISTTYLSKSVKLVTGGPFPAATGQLVLKFPSSVQVTYPYTTYPSTSTSTSLTFSSIVSSDQLPGSALSMGGITVVTPPSSRPFAITITTQWVQGGTTYGIETNTINYFCQTGPLTSVSAVPTSASVNAVTQYLLTFTISNALTSGSFATINFPQQLAATVGACSTNNSFITCSVSNSSSATLAITGSIAASSTIKVTFPSVKNPKQAQTTASFQIYTYYDSGTDSMVDKVTSGVTMTSTANSISTATVTAASAVTYALTSYTFYAVLPDLIPAGGYLKFDFPSTIAFGNVSISSASFSTSTCVISSSVSTINITGCFSADMTSGNMTVILNGLYNPPSLQPTSTFSIYTYGPLGMVDSIVTGLIVTMATPATTSSFTANPLVSTVHTFSQYNLGFTFAVPHQINDYLTFTIPASMAFSATPACSPISGITSVACTLINTTTVKITLNAVPLSTAQISISTIRNYDIATSQSFQAFFYNSLGYAMESTSAASATYTAMTISTISLNNNDQIALYEKSNLTLTISTPFAMDSSFLANQTTLTITPPANFDISTNTTCSPLSGVCTISNGSMTITNVGLSLTAFTVSINKITLPYFSPASTSFNVIYSYAGSQVAVASSGVVVSVFCTSPCERCISTQTACASCLPAPNTAVYLHTANNSCLNACPDGYYANSTLCVLCNSPCLYCSDSVNCTKCTITTYLYNSACLASCPPSYFGNSSNICQPCVSPCFNCTSSTACTSCATNFYTNSSCVTAANCPPGTFGDIASLICAPCNSPCQTCTLTSSNCTSCVPGYVLYQNNCPTLCPNGYYNNSNFCSACVSPCGNCTSSTSCLNCLTDFLSGTSCVTAGNCPTGTYANNASNTCTSCPAGCTSCSTVSICLGCATGYVFYNFTCLISCPGTTYQSTSNACIDCVGCLTCSGSATSCNSCTPPQLLLGTSCVSACSGGTYSNGVTCAACSPSCLTCTNTSSNCLSCTGSLYLSGNICISNCPAGTFQDATTNNCSACSSLCATCSSSSTSCTGCYSSKVYYQGTCTGSCPVNYFNISGYCQTCSSCLSCISVSVCAVCYTGYYIFNGACYTSCPAIAIADISTMTCVSCNSSCATCSGTINNCLSCSGSLSLLNGICYSSCPSGYAASGGECIKYQLGSIVYFPFSITFAVLLIIVIYSKVNHAQTEVVTALCGILAILAWISWVVLVYQASNTDSMLLSNARSVILGMGLVGILISVILGFLFAIWFRYEFKTDNGFNQWACHANKNLNAYRLVLCMTLVGFPCFRLIYSRLFNSSSLSCFFLKGGELLSGSGKFAFLYVVTCLFPLLFVSGYVIYIKQLYDQTLISAIDSLLLDIFLVILIIIDTHSKDESFFDQMVDDQPYLKKLKYNQLNHSLSSIRDDSENPRARHKSEVAEKDKQDFFRTKITVIDNLNKFGHLNEPIPERPGRERKAKTLPNDMENLPRFDANQDQIKVIDEDFFFQEEEKRRRLQEEERLRLQEQERRKREQQEVEERLKRKRLADEDMDEQHQVEFPDLAAIEKLERKGQNMKKSPTHILNNFKKVEDKGISQKDRKKIEQMAKKNGLDPTFMSETFAIEKHHNPELLNAIIDIHNHVDRQAVKALFAATSNPEVLQEMFSKKSTMDANKLRNILNDPQSAEMIKNLASLDEGILSPDVAKLLLDGSNKFSEEFVKELLMCSKGQTLDPAKLREMLKDCPDKASREAALKALKKIGGNNLENKELLENLLGEESHLQAANFTRVANDLSKKAVNQLFREKSETNKTIITKLLNNKKIDLKNLSTILEDPELVEQLARALGSGNKALQENLLNLFKNGEQLDPELLKEFFARPALLDKLISQPVDPAFLTSLLKKDAKTDISLLEKAIQNMTPEQIGKVFEFNPEKNVDFAKLARLFEFNSKSDPALIADLLTPEVVENVYNKASSARPEMLNKLVEKGKQIDPDAVVKIYGDTSKPFRDTGRVGDGKIIMGQDGKLMMVGQNGKMTKIIVGQDGKLMMVGQNGKMVMVGQKGKVMLSQGGRMIMGEDGKMVMVGQDGRAIGQGGRMIVGEGGKMMMVGEGSRMLNPDHEGRMQKELSRKYNNTDNNFNLAKEDLDDELGYKKGINQVNMSRTDGRMLGFLSPIQVGQHRNKKYKNGLNPINGRGRNNINDIDDIDDEQITEYNDGEGEREKGEDDDEYQIVQEGGRRRRRRKIKKKPLDDIRLPSEHIYLQRLEAPHELKKKNIRKKKKKGSSSMQQLEPMDEDNEVYDLDF